MKKLLLKQPELRSIQQFAKIKNDPFFQEFDWQKLSKKKLLPPFISNTKDTREQSKINMKVGEYMNEIRKSQKGKRVESKIANWD